MDTEQPVTIQYKPTGSERYGIYAHPYGSTSFQAKLEQILGSKSPPALEDALPFCLIVENRSSETLRGYVVRYSFVSENGKPGEFTVRLVNSSPTSRHGPPPGEVRCVCINSQLESAIAQRKLDTIPPGALAAVQRYRAKRNMEISVDSVVLMDGRIAGPDVSNTVDFLNTALAANRDLIRLAIELKDKPEDLRRILETKSQVRALARDVYPTAQHGQARSMLLQLQQMGPAAFNAMVEQWQANDSGISFRRAEP